MFYTEEDVLPVVQMAENLLGKSGTITTDAEHKNAAVATKKFGKIWYGDIRSEDLINLKTLRAFTGEDLYVFLNDNIYDYELAIRVT